MDQDARKQVARMMWDMLTALAIIGLGPMARRTRRVWSLSDAIKGKPID